MEPRLPTSMTGSSSSTWSGPEPGASFEPGLWLGGQGGNSAGFSSAPGWPHLQGGRAGGGQEPGPAHAHPQPGIPSSSPRAGTKLQSRPLALHQVWGDEAQASSYVGPPCQGCVHRPGWGAFKAFTDVRQGSEQSEGARPQRGPSANGPCISRDTHPTGSVCDTRVYSREAWGQTCFDQLALRRVFTKLEFVAKM